MVTTCSPRSMRAAQRARLWAITCTARRPRGGETARLRDRRSLGILENPRVGSITFTWRRNGKAAGSAFLGHPRESPRGQIHIMTLGRPRVLRNPRSFSPSLPNATSAGRWASRPTWSSRSGSASSPTPWPPLRRLTGWCTTRSSWSLTSPATALMPLSNGARQMR